MSAIYHCHYCKRALLDPRFDRSGRRAKLSLTRDHVTPLSRGGRKTVPCCWHCNNLKGDMMPQEWRSVMARWPDWYKRFKNRGHLLEVLSRRRRGEARAFAATAPALRIRRFEPRFPSVIRLPAPLCRGLP